MDTGERVRWGILGTAGIAASAFLPALAEAGGGEAAVVGESGRRPCGEMGGGARCHPRRRGVPPGDRGPDDRGGLHPVAERTARRVDDRGAGGRQGGVLREAVVRHARGDGAGAGRGGGHARTAVGGVRLSVPRADASGCARCSTRARSARCARCPRGSTSRCDDPQDVRLLAVAVGRVRRRMSAATRSGWLGSSSRPSRTRRARSPTPCGPTGWISSSGARWPFPASGGSSCRAGSAAPTTRSRACWAPRARSA